MSSVRHERCDQPLRPRSLRNTLRAQPRPLSLSLSLVSRTQTEKVFADFERRINEILPCSGGGTAAGGAAGGVRQRGAHNGHSAAPGSAMAAAAAEQAETGSLIFAATGAAPVALSTNRDCSLRMRLGASKSNGLLTRDEEELLRQHLKRKHAASILSLKEEFMRKRNKGKLPKDATSALKTWWVSNLVWPYPTVRLATAPDGALRVLLQQVQLHRQLTMGIPSWHVG